MNRYDAYSRQYLVDMIEARDACLVGLERELQAERYLTARLRARVAECEETVQELRLSRRTARGVAETCAKERAALAARVTRCWNVATNAEGGSVLAEDVLGALTPRPGDVVLRDSSQ